MLSEDNSRPFGLACLPGVLQPESVIGVSYQGERAVVITSAEVLDGNKRKIETDVVAFDFGSVGSDSLEWAEVHSDILFSAATVDTDRKVVYLARAGELYVTDLRRQETQTGTGQHL